MFILCIDNEPGRFDHFCFSIERDHPEVRWMIGSHPEEVQLLVNRADAILLDHDMPYRNGVSWAECKKKKENSILKKDCSIEKMDLRYSKPRMGTFLFKK